MKKLSYEEFKEYVRGRMSYLWPNAEGGLSVIVDTDRLMGFGRTEEEAITFFYERELFAKLDKLIDGKLTESELVEKVGEVDLCSTN